MTEKGKEAYKRYKEKVLSGDKSMPDYFLDAYELDGNLVIQRANVDRKTGNITNLKDVSIKI